MERELKTEKIIIKITKSEKSEIQLLADKYTRYNMTALILKAIEEFKQNHGEV